MSETNTYRLSVVIVNYNVEHFLKQCLESVVRASKNISTEIIVVDNSSVDGSIEMINNNFREVQLIANKDNLGFSKANNQAMKVSKGDYILLLNPDTVVAEDSFEKTVAFMDKHEDCGGLGVRMIDGTGKFLPESKRGLPKPWVAFYKIFGLASIFPRSKKFGQYHQGHLSEFEVNETEVLSGAFMMMRKSYLDKVDLLDEDYFMYGEDIDLSYRITQGGYKNYYYPDTTIIHYKGESTKKSSVNYVVIFYKAMVIFARKHFSGKNASLSSLLINLAIYLRAFAAVLNRIVRISFLPLFDGLYLVCGLYLLTNYWKISGIEFPEDLIKYSIPLYALAWLGSCFISGAYDYPQKLAKYIKGVIIGTAVILIAYAVLPKDFQFSRLFIFIGAGWTIAYYLLSRVFFHIAFKGKFRLFRPKRRFGVVSVGEKFEDIQGLIQKTQTNVGVIESINAPSSKLECDTLVFSSEQNEFKQIISWMSELAASNREFKIASNTNDVLIGSNSIDTSGELYLLNINVLRSDENRRKKRLFDLVLSSFLLISSPILAWFFSNPTRFISNLAKIWIGMYSFIGYSEEEIKRDVRLPKIRLGILSPADAVDNADEQLKDKLNLLYARDYSMRKDFTIVLKLWRTLDR